MYYKILYKCNNTLNANSMRYYIVLLSTQLEKQSLCSDLFHRHLDVFVADVPLRIICTLYIFASLNLS